MKVKQEHEKAGLKLNIQKMKIMASSPITSWQRWGNLGNGNRLYFLGLHITADGDCSHEIKRHLQKTNKQKKTLAPWKKNYDQPR